MSTIVGTMKVTLVNARGLKDNEFFAGGIDPYVLIHYRGQRHKSSTARGEGSDPTWNEKFSFRVEFPSADEEYKLILKIMDHDTFSSDDYLGQTTVYLKELFELGIENGSYELHPQKYPVVGSDQSFCGEIKVGEGSDPTWNEKFSFRVEFPSADEEYKLILTIMDHDTFSDNYVKKNKKNTWHWKGKRIKD